MLLTFEDCIADNGGPWNHYTPDFCFTNIKYSVDDIVEKDNKKYKIKKILSVEYKTPEFNPYFKDDANNYIIKTKCEVEEI